MRKRKNTAKRRITNDLLHHPLTPPPDDGWMATSRNPARGRGKLKMNRRTKMLDERQRKTSEQFGLTEKIEKLQRELLEIEYIEDVDFDLDGFYDNLNEVIFLTKYNIPVSLRRKMVEEILETAARNGLKRTEDRIEDYGTWLYFVTKYQTPPDSRKERNEKQ